MEFKRRGSWRVLLLGTLGLFAVACDDAGNGSDRPDGGDRPHPQYSALDLADLPGAGGGAVGAYAPPSPPSTTRSIIITEAGVEAGRALMTACETPGTAVSVPDAAGYLGVVNLGDIEDCDIELGGGVVMERLIIGSLPGPQHAPASRLRVRGGQIATLFVAGGSTDLIFDGVAFNTGSVASSVRSSVGIHLGGGETQDEVVERMVVVNSFIRMLPVESQSGVFEGAAFLGSRARDLLFANNNIVTAGNHDSWGFRLSGGDNILIVDNTVRVSFHKLIRLNDAPVDYVYVRGGTWIREDATTVEGLRPNDSFAQLGSSGVDHIYIHDTEVYLLMDVRAGFGMISDPVQAGRSWQARRIAWHAPSEVAMSPDVLMSYQDACVPSAICDYGIDTHTFDYDPALVVPANPWRDLPSFSNDDPDALPIAP